MEERELIARVRAGDGAAERALYDAHVDRVYRLAYRLAGDDQLAREFTQDTFVRAFERLASFRGEAKLSTWLTRIVVNEALERRRRAARRRRQLDSQGVSFIESYREALMRGSESSPGPEQAVMRTELARVIEAAIARLPEVFRPAFVLREIEGLSVAETAAALGLAEATVRTRIHRARLRLQADLAPEMEGVRAATAQFAGLDCQALTERVLAKLGIG